MQKNNYLFVLAEQKSATFAENLKLKDMEKNNIIDFEKVLDLQITVSNGQVFSRKRIESGKPVFEYTCYQGTFRPVYDPSGLYFNMMYHGKIVKYVPDNDEVFADLMSNDADVLKKAMNYVYHRAKHMTYIGNNK